MRLPQTGLASLVLLSFGGGCHGEQAGTAAGGEQHDVSPAQGDHAGTTPSPEPSSANGDIVYIPVTGEFWFPEEDAAAAKDSGAPPSDAAAPETDAGHEEEHPLTDAGVGSDAAPTDAGSGTCIAKEKLDVLFVVDNSRSMTEEQATLAASLTKLVQQLTTGDVDGDGQSDIEPATDLHLGVISTDLGADGVAGIPSCEKNGAFGDDGVLVSAARDPSCSGFMLGAARYQSYVPGGAQTSAEIAADFGCLVALGTDGCGFEQPLEAAYKALAPQNVRFARDTGGHGDAQNAGFLRDDAKLAIVIVSDEDDCSVRESGLDLFIPDSTAASILLPDREEPMGLNMRCTYAAGGEQSLAESRDLVQPVARYVDGFKALKPGRPDAIVFGAIVGIPLAVDGQPLAKVLANDGMRVIPDVSGSGGGDPANGATVPVPACVRADAEGTVLTSATPGRRFVRAAQGFGDNGIVRSICEEGFQPALHDIVTRIGAVSAGCP